MRRFCRWQRGSWSIAIEFTRLLRLQASSSQRIAGRRTLPDYEVRMGKHLFAKLACSALKANGINRLVGQSEILTLNFTLVVVVAVALTFQLKPQAAPGVSRLTPSCHRHRRFSLRPALCRVSKFDAATINGLSDFIPLSQPLDIVPRLIGLSSARKRRLTKSHQLSTT